MANQSYNYMWRCAKCSYHFANITKMEGVLKQEKKCPKCKSLNILTLADREIFIHCKIYDPRFNGYTQEEVEESYPYPGMP